jgi:Apea-like HEPN
MHYTTQSLKVMRRVARGETVAISWVVGYTGFLLKGIRELVTPWGRLLPGTLPGWLVPEPWQSETTAILAGELDATVWICNPEPDALRAEDWARVSSESRRRRLVLRELVPLALILGSSAHRTFLGQEVKPRVVWQLPLPPWHPTPDFSPAPPANFSPSHWYLQQIDAWAAAQAERFARLLETNYGEGVALACRRILSAAVERQRWDDILVDSVIAWENLVGGEAETNFRTTVAMAHLLEPSSFERRREAQARLQRIYSARSQVVHGSSVSPEWRLEKGRPKVGISVVALSALRSAIQALRALLDLKPELLQQDATSRSKELALGLGQSEPF